MIEKESERQKNEKIVNIENRLVTNTFRKSGRGKEGAGIDTRRKRKIFSIRQDCERKRHKRRVKRKERMVHRLCDDCGAKDSQRNTGVKRRWERKSDSPSYIMVSATQN